MQSLETRSERWRIGRPTATVTGAVANLRAWVFPFLFGAFLGGVAGLLVEDEPEPPAPPAPALTVPPPPEPPERVRSPAPSPEADDPTLAQALELARFDGDWEQVGAVARILRERVAATAAGTRPPGEGQLGELLALDSRGSLLALDQQYRHLLAWLEVRGRDNRATRLLTSEPDPAERERRLIELFLQAPASPEDEVVLGDAARLLAWSHREEARRALLTALQDPSPLRAEQAAQALALSRDPAAEAALADALLGEREPALRVRVARALASGGDLRQGGPAVAALAQTATADRDPDVRAEAIAGLVRADLARVPAAQAALLQVAEQDSEPEPLRLAALQAIHGHFQLARELPPAVVSALEGLLERTTPPLRTQVITTLGEAGRAGTIPLLETARLSSRSADERAALEEALANLRRRAAPE